MRWLVFALALCSCTGPDGDPTPRPDQDRAVELVWNGVFGMGHLAAPTIRWVNADELDCQHDTGWSEGSRCVYGVGWGTAESGHAVLIAWPEGGRFSTTAFAHELLHRAIGGDPDHLTHHWQPGGRLEAANRALEGGGL
jgi:hypothetical protein